MDVPALGGSQGGQEQEDQRQGGRGRGDGHERRGDARQDRLSQEAQEARQRPAQGESKFPQFPGYTRDNDEDFENMERKNSRKSF